MSGGGLREDTVRATVSRVYKHEKRSKPHKWLGVVAMAELGSKGKKTSLFTQAEFSQMPRKRLLVS